MDDEKLTPEQEAEFEAWKAKLEALSKRLAAQHREPPPERLTPELIANTSDNELGDLLLEFVDGRKPADWTGDDYAWLTDLPEGVQLIWASLAVESEIENGGFNQFFFNGTDTLAPLAIVGFGAIGAAGYAEVVSKALERAQQSGGTVVKSWAEGSMEDFMGSYDEEVFEDLDDRWSELDKQFDLGALRASWIRAHVADMVSG